MQNYKVIIQYDGTDYHGWQVQPNRVTIQGELTRILSQLDDRPVTVYGAGRTDAGVHAEGQVANFWLEHRFSSRELRDAMNGNLRRDIRILDALALDDAFNARTSAKLKNYRYRIWNADVGNPFLSRYVYQYRKRLDIDEMHEAAAALVGAHDFSAFTPAQSDAEDHFRTLQKLDLERDGEIVSITAAASGFLRYMVRTIAGTLIDVGRGRRSAKSVRLALESRMRSNAGPTAPACGLTLMRVDY